MKIAINERDILKEEVRAQIIKEINGSENVKRKVDAKKRTEIYKDNTRRYVLEQLRKELDADTVAEMETRIANISILKKIINKKARVYSLAPLRKSKDEQYQLQVESLAAYLNVNSTMKKIDRYKELHRNCAAYIVPCQNKQTGAWEIKLRVLDPSHYDVIEDTDNPEEGIVFIYSYFTEQINQESALLPMHNNTGTANFRTGDGKNQAIADSPSDESNCNYVWWSNSLHFTTDSKGEIITGASPEDLGNPIKRLPVVFFSKNQDGSFWAQGGEDLIDGSILVNQILTDLYFIAKIQGMGIFYLFGKGVPKAMKFGPNHAITLEVKEGEPTPSIGFATSNPPIESFMRMVEQYLALLLSTNDLEPNSVAGQLTTANASSGIQELIRGSEVTSAIEDEQEQYLDKECCIFEVAAAWLNIYLDKKLACKELTEIGKVNLESCYSLQFQKPQQFTSEKEKLEVIEKRVDMGLDSKLEAMMRDNTDLTVEEAKSKMLLIAKEKLEKASFEMVKEVTEDGNQEE